ncbi:hypothetical protein WN48_00469 [Eufriesea mexicana]|uniref:Uncharacterized protein n=1 Tax=Eufriesea mexicana TaxID=516756 RepID=A0A310S8L7_9HYME|nr:hypothetical protein WN48_00469 [Eufriesea mexicana]
MKVTHAMPLDYVESQCLRFLRYASDMRMSVESTRNVLACFVIVIILDARVRSHR